MISIIIITYNQAKYISKCLDSILMQEINEPMEILVGDDCSTDETGEILLRYASVNQKKIKLFLRRENIGATANLFGLLKIAKGRYIAFCEGDDYWNEKSKLSEQIAFLEKNTVCSAVVHKINVVDENENEIKPQNVDWISYKKIFKLKDYDALKLPGHLSSMLVKNNEIFKQENINSMLCDRNCSDKIVFLVALVIGKIGFIDKYLSSYRLIRNGTNILSNIYTLNESRAYSEIKMIVAMENWLVKNQKIQHYFIKAQSKWLITSLFHKLKGFKVDLCNIWLLCNHKILCVCFMPYMISLQVINKIMLEFKYKIR